MLRLGMMILTISLFNIATPGGPDTLLSRNQVPKSVIIAGFLPKVLSKEVSGGAGEDQKLERRTWVY